MEVRRIWADREDAICMVIGEVWDYISDDALTPDQHASWRPRIDDGSRWYISLEGDEVVGVHWMRRVNAITWEAHANIRPKFWGNKLGTEHCRHAFKGMMTDTGAQKVILLVPDNCPQVQRMAESLGFRQEGRQVASFLKNGKVYDQVHYGITRKQHEFTI